MDLANDLDRAVVVRRGIGLGNGLAGEHARGGHRESDN
jgi:hypothetical protein